MLDVSASSRPLPSSLFCLLLLLKTASKTAAKSLFEGDTISLEVSGGTISRLTLLDLDMLLCC